MKNSIQLTTKYVTSLFSIYYYTKQIPIDKATYALKYYVYKHFFSQKNVERERRTNASSTPKFNSGFFTDSCISTKLLKINVADNGVLKYDILKISLIKSGA